MCGILGLFATPWQAQARHALNALHSRGPDAQTILDLGDAVLGHARLAVIDLSTGDQPMQSKDGRYVIIFNGELYNFRQIRTELEKQGQAFYTQSDTEVMLQAFITWGPAMLPRLDGMFAFSVFDKLTKRVFSARDRVGIKPLFYSLHQGLIVSSTLEPFFQIKGFPRRLNYEALRDFLAFQTVMAPDSMLRDVRQLPPASYLEYDLTTGTSHIERYWSIPPAEDDVPSLEDAIASADVAIAASVRDQMVADVPLGAFLSGGIDSSLLVHYMAEASSTPLRTFSVRFAGTGFDESKYAQMVAEKYATEHHIIDAPNIRADEFVTAIQSLDQPLADPAYIPAQALARVTRQHVTVAISGDGGDELFGGYPRFLDEEGNYPASTNKALLRKLVEAGLLPGALLRRSLSEQEMLLYRKVELGPWAQSRKSLSHYLSHNAWEKCIPHDTLHTWRKLALSFSNTMDTDSLMRADLWSYLSENCLMKSDRASMAHSLEIRVPLLGNAVMDSALRLPGKMHFTRGDKTILRSLAQRHLPEAVWNREKHGFSVPLGDYFTGSWKDASGEGLSKLAQTDLFNNAAITKLWHDTLAGKASRRLAYTFVVLGLWLDNHSFTE